MVHDGGDFLQYSAAKVVLDNLIHRREIADMVVAFSHPKDRLVEYANSAEHARFLTHELLPQLDAEFPLVRDRSGRGLLGASFGAVAALSAAYRSPRTYGSLALMSGSFVSADAGTDHGGGRVFDPVVRFVNRYRERPRRVTDRLFVSCGLYEPLIISEPLHRAGLRGRGNGCALRRGPDGHTWENWRDRLRDALTWVFPGPALADRLK